MSRNPPLVIELTSFAYENWVEELKLDLGSEGSPGARFFDAYLIKVGFHRSTKPRLLENALRNHSRLFVLKSAWFSEYAEIGALEPLGDRVREAGSRLDWTGNGGQGVAGGKEGGHEWLVLGAGH